MKRIGALFLILTLLLCGCSTEPSLVVTNGDNCYGITAENFSSSKSTQLTAVESAEITLNITAHVKKGLVKYTCLNSAGETVYEADLSAGGVYSYKLTGPDTYTLTVDCTKFTGDFMFDWEIIGAVATDRQAPEVVVVDPNAMK